MGEPDESGEYDAEGEQAEEPEELTAADLIAAQDTVMRGAPALVRHSFVTILALKDRASDDRVSMMQCEKGCYRAALSRLQNYLNGETKGLHEDE